jgi:hypothetical protein
VDSTPKCNPDNYAIRMIDLVNVKGKNEIITIYEVFDADTEKIKAAKFATLDLLNRALALYRKKFQNGSDLSNLQFLWLNCDHFLQCRNFCWLTHAPRESPYRRLFIDPS